MTRRPAVRARLGGAHADLGIPHLVVDPDAGDASLARFGDARAVVEAGGERHRVLLGPASGGSREVVIGGWRFVVEVEPEVHAALRERARRGRPDAGVGGPTEVRAAIPGRVLSVAVGEGDEVVAGQPLVVVEAMKMQNELRSPRVGTVRRVAVGAGETIELGDVLVVLE